MKTPITSIKRLALALCFVTPLVSWAAVDYTDTAYEPWSYSAGCVVWRGTQNNFHESTIADVAADGTVGDAYTLNTSGHPWQVFASNQSSYTSPGLTLVFDASGYKADPDASFTPLSFGGLKVDALADETEGTPYSITGISTAARYTDFGRTDVATYFEFNKSFTVNRSSATRCYGAVTIQVAQGATFKSQGSLWAEVGGTVKLTGEGTVELPAGLYVNNNSTSTLDLSAATRPTITGNVTIYEGGAIALPAGTEPSEETPFTVCSGTLTVSTYNYVKIGDADPISATLTVSGGAITGIEPYALERTFTSDYPTVVPAGAVFTFQGGTEDEPVVLDARTVNGTLKTEGYFSFTSYAASASSTLEVVSGKVTLDPGNNWFRGTLTIDADAEFVNASTDAVQYGGTFTANVHGTLNMGSTRWSLGANNTINLYEGCTVTGSGQGNNGALDWIEDITGTLNVTGPVTIGAPIRIRSGATVNVTVDSGANEGLTLGTTIGVGTIVKKGAGLIKFTTNPSYAITCQNGAFTFGVNATPTITYTAKPSNSTSMWYAKQSTWKGTVVIPAIAAGNTSTQILLESWGNANSSLTLNGISGNTWLTSNVTVPAAVTVAGDVGFSNGSKGSTYTFSKIAGGTGNLTFKAWANNASAKYAITELDADNYSGTIVIPSSNANQMTVKLGNIVKTGAGAGDKLVAISNGGGTFDISTATLNGEAADLEVKSDGIYVAVPATTVDITIPEVANATVSVTADGVAVTPVNGVVTVDIGAAVVVTYTAAEGYQLTGNAISFTASASTTTVDVSNISIAAIVANVTSADGQTTTPYTSAASAIAAADDGETVTLLEATVSLTEVVAINKSITILSGNVSGTTITGSGLSAYPTLGAANLTLGANVTVSAQLRVLSGEATITHPTGSAPSYRPPSGYMTSSRNNGDDTTTITFYQQVYVSAAGTNATLADENGNPLGSLTPVASGDTFVFTVTPAAGCTLVRVTAGGVELTPSEGKYSISIGSSNVSIYAVAGVAVVTGGDYDEYCSSLQAALDAATDGDTVTLLADATLPQPMYTLSKTITLNLNGKTLSAEGDTAKTAKLLEVVGGKTLTVVGTTAGSTVYGRINVGNASQEGNLTIQGGYYEVGAQTVVHVNGKRTNSSVSITGATIVSTADNGIQLNGAGTHTITDTSITGATAVYLKAGSLAISGTTTLEATGAKGAVTANNNGSDATGDALVIDNCAPPYQQITGVTIASTVTLTSANASAILVHARSGCTRQTKFVPAAVKDNITEVVATEADVFDDYSSGIDPTDPTSTQEVTVDTSLTAEEQEAAAIAAATVTVPDGVSGVDAATYKTYFTYSATPTETAGTYTVAITGFADEVTETADGNALSALEAATAGTALGSITVKPGLYYGTAAGADVTTLKAPAGTLNTTGTLDLSGVTKPSEGTAFFIKIKIGATAFTAEE